MLHKEQTTFLFQWIYTLKSLLTSKICHCFSLGSNEAEWKGRGATSGALWTPTVIFGKETESAPRTSFRKSWGFRETTHCSSPLQILVIAIKDRSAVWKIMKNTFMNGSKWRVWNNSKGEAQFLKGFFILWDIREHCLQTQHTQCMWVK